MTAALTVGILVAGGVYMMLQRELLRVTFGFVLLGHAVNVLFVTSGGLDRRAPALLGQTAPEDAADPLPQAFVLTAIVITFGITVYLLALMRAEGLRRKHAGEQPEGDGPETPDDLDVLAAERAGTGRHSAPGTGPTDGIDIPPERIGGTEEDAPASATGGTTADSAANDGTANDGTETAQNDATGKGKR
ncbi:MULTISPECIES: sodium:proton antiporter [unclassified Streptomyces]|uniref:sodium:proton antiporter n=1 Tax=unclassified Streptomyces TaxID=2593676 RepID=UPI0011AFE6CF|nr:MULTISPECIES: cation:proton antiporter subunit C [unclassified Streptomyces]